jgi:phosphatidylserine/phosphatidylglycerophosphate/cardiolipin synthase-like enzyme
MSSEKPVLFSLDSQSAEVICGRAIGDEVLKRLYDDVREVVIVSPWISPETASRIKALAKRISVTLVTMDDPQRPPHQAALSSLYEFVTETVRPTRAWLIALGVLMIILIPISAMAAAAYLLLHVPASYVTPISIIMGAAIIGSIIGGIASIIMGMGRTRTVRVTPLKGLYILPNIARLHSKMIILPDKGVVGLGSMNITGGGLHGNIECWTWIRDEDITKKALEFVNWLTTQSTYTPQATQATAQTIEIERDIE